MIGADYQARINQLLSEFTSTWIDVKTTYDLLYEAAKDFSKETHSCHNSQTITTIANQAEYGINPDFLEVLTTDDHGDAVLKYSDGSSSWWLGWQSYSDFLQNGNDPSTPQNFSITDASLSTRITGTSDTSSSEAGGESYLSDSGTVLTGVYPGDVVMNTTHGYIGVALASGTTIKTAMFDVTTRGGAYVGWTAGNGYVIQPSARYQLVLDPPPDTSGQTITVPYFAKPLPVYSDYGQYPFATGYEEAMIKYAVWLYKYKDSKPNMGDPLYLVYEKEMRKGKNVNRKAVGGVGFRINYMKH
jgi:hypothetical protein